MRKEWLLERRRLWMILAVVAAVVVTVGLLLWRHARVRSASDVIRTAVVERGTLRVNVTASGRIEPAAEVDLSFDLPGRVEDVLVDLGDAVREGQPLARLNATELALAVQQAQAALAAAEAQLALLEVGARPEEIAASEAQLQAAQATLAQAVAQRDELEGGAVAAELAAAEAQLAAAVRDQWIANDTHERTMDCRTVRLPDGRRKEVCPGLGRPEETARYNLYAADEALAAAQSQVDALTEAQDDRARAANASVWAAAAQRDTAQAQLDLLQAGSSAEEIAAAEARVAEAEATLGVAHNNLDNATLLAPFDGLVSVVNVTAGEAAPTGLPAITVVDLSHFRITVSVDEIDVAKLEPELPAEVTVDALSYAALAGIVERIGPASTMDQGAISYPVVVALDETDAPVRPGMSATAVIMVDELADQLLIPNWVVRIDQITGQPYVYRQVDRSRERVDVRLGVRYEGYSQVLDGLSEGDTVVLVRENNGFPFGQD
jgi:HlyD family secretion protein